MTTAKPKDSLQMTMLDEGFFVIPTQSVRCMETDPEVRGTGGINKLAGGSSPFFPAWFYLQHGKQRSTSIYCEPTGSPP
jgi:hypothetical protein